MDIAFYVLLTVACVVLILGMCACAAGGINKWGPDLTHELPVHVIRDALYPKPNKRKLFEEVTPSAPSDLACDPLLNHAQGPSFTEPPPSKRPLFSSPMVRVLPTGYVPLRKERAPVYSFSSQ